MHEKMQFPKFNRENDKFVSEKRHFYRFLD